MKYLRKFFENQNEINKCWLLYTKEPYFSTGLQKIGVPTNEISGFVNNGSIRRSDLIFI